MPAPKFSKVSQWIAAGSMKAGFYLLEDVAEQSEKAIAFNAQKFTSAGNLKLAVCWIPKSQLIEVVNDYYATGPAQMFLIPAWLYYKKRDEGFEL